MTAAWHLCAPRMCCKPRWRLLRHTYPQAQHATQQTSRQNSRAGHAGSKSGRRCTHWGGRLADLVEHTCRHAVRFAEGLRAAGYTILNEVVLNQVLVTFGDDERTRRVIAGIQRDGTCWCGGTIWQGHTAMRISVTSWATTEADVERSLQAMIRVAREKA